MHPSAHSLNFCSDDPNACLSCADPSVVNPSQREDVFIPSHGGPSLSQILICQRGDTSDTQTDGTRCRMHVVLSVFLRLSCRRFLSTSRPLVYWHHQLTTTSPSICSTNDGVVKSINLQAAHTRGDGEWWNKKNFHAGREKNQTKKNHAR